MNLTKVRKAFTARIEPFVQGVKIVGPNETPVGPPPKESVEIVASESGQVIICDDTVQLLGNIDFRIVAPISTGTGRVDSLAEMICNAFPVLDHEKNYVKTDDHLTLLITETRQYPGGFLDQVNYSVTVRISFQTFIKQGE